MYLRVTVLLFHLSSSTFAFDQRVKSGSGSRVEVVVAAGCPALPSEDWGKARKGKRMWQPRGCSLCLFMVIQTFKSWLYEKKRGKGDKERRGHNGNKLCQREVSAEFGWGLYELVIAEVMNADVHSVLDMRWDFGRLLVLRLTIRLSLRLEG